MSARAIVAGVLFRTPVEKFSKAGKRYVAATIREGSGEVARWWRAFIFSESAIEAILALDDGEPIAVAGEFNCESRCGALGATQAEGHEAARRVSSRA